MIEHGHSRVPVYRETLDDVIGFIHVKDVLAPVADRRPAKLAPMLRKVLFVAPSLPVLDLLVQMRQARTHIAMVVDEFGGIDGLVTIEDLIEEIVGEIEDEHDVADDADPGRAARRHASSPTRALPIEELEEHHGARLRPNGDQEEVDTLGGLVFTLAGRVPRRGEVIAHPERASNSRCSTPTRAGSSACGCAACRPQRNGAATARAPAMPEVEAAALRVRPGARMATPLCRLAQELGEPDRLAALWRWRCCLGALLAAALPPVDITPLAFVVFPAAALARRRQPDAVGVRAARLCLRPRLFVAGLYWIAAALFVDIAQFWWALPFAVLGLPAVLRCVHRRWRWGCRRSRRARLQAVGDWPASASLRCYGPRRVAARPSLHRAFRGTWSAMPGPAAFPARWRCCRATAWIGIYGLSFVPSSPLRCRRCSATPSLTPVGAVRRVAPAVAAALLILVPAGVGAIRLSCARRPTPASGCAWCSRRSRRP